MLFSNGFLWKLGTLKNMINDQFFILWVEWPFGGYTFRVFQRDTSSIWANYNISLTWIKAIWGWFPLLTMISSEGEQWGRYNLPRSMDWHSFDAGWGSRQTVPFVMGETIEAISSYPTWPTKLQVRSHLTWHSYVSMVSPMFMTLFGHGRVNLPWFVTLGVLHYFLAGWWYTYPSEKYESQLGSLFPIYGEKNNFQTTNQSSRTWLVNPQYVLWNIPYINGNVRILKWR